MTAIDVVWVSHHQPEILARKYWDQSLTEALFDRSIWRPAAGFTFEHRDGFEELPADADGAVVVIPARHHADDTDWLNEQLARLAWVLVILTGDEERDFPIERLTHASMLVWVQTPDPTRDGAHRPLGDGWSPGTREAVARSDTKTADFFFAGQNNNPARQACIDVLRRAEGGTVVETEGFIRGLDHDAYLQRLAQARVAPCPSGIFTPDTFRLFEALEAGCVPVAERGSPKRGDVGYWPFLFGADPPFPLIDSWAEFPAVLERILGEWPASANRVSAWWQGYKRDLAYALDDDLRHLSGIVPPAEGTRDLVTVLMPTSPTPGHPGTADIETVIASLRAQPQLADCEIIILADGPRPDTDHARYDEYLRRLLWKANNEWHNVLVLVFGEYLHQAARTRAALDWVRTPLVFFVEHDTPLVNETDFDGIARVVMSDQANLVRLHHEASVLPEHEFLMVDHDTQVVDGVPLRRTADWSQRPHIAKTEFYRDLMATYIGREARTFIETVMYGVVRQHWQLEGEAGWERFRLWLYAPEPTMQRSIHIDSRRGDPLCPEVFAYDGPTPEHAPNPHHLRDEAR